jgi:hypothetical protein
VQHAVYSADGAIGERLTVSSAGGAQVRVERVDVLDGQLAHGHVAEPRVQVDLEHAVGVAHGVRCPARRSRGVPVVEELAHRCVERPPSRIVDLCGEDLELGCRLDGRARTVRDAQRLRPVFGSTPA